MYLKKFALRLPFFFARRLARLNPESEPRSEKAAVSRLHPRSAIAKLQILIYTSTLGLSTCFPAFQHFLSHSLTAPSSCQDQNPVPPEKLVVRLSQAVGNRLEACAIAVRRLPSAVWIR
jgi:hypothetical protein